MRTIAVEGVGLHSGKAARVVFDEVDGPVRIRVSGVDVRIDELKVASTSRSTAVVARRGALRLSTVEHLFGALAGLAIYEGVAIAIDGPELPLLDGAAAMWCEALAQFDVIPKRPRLRVAREGVIRVGRSRYDLVPGDSVAVGVELETDDDRVAPNAQWDGDSGDFRARIATARTFAFERDLDDLARRGLARHVDRACVVVIASDAIHHSGPPFFADEPARHKLLDLIGDLYVYGGPPLGRLRALRPGHAANAHAIRAAIAEGIVVPQ